MPHGLQVFSADGTIDLDTNTRTGRILGTIAVNESSPTYQNFTIPRVAGELCFCTGMIQSRPAGGNFAVSYAIVATAGGAPDPSGNIIDIAWFGSDAGSGSGIIFYGVR